MRHDVKHLADSMQAGWSKIPRNCPGKSWYKRFDEVIACCPLMHASVGHVHRIVSLLALSEHFPILLEQHVIDRNNSEVTLLNAVIQLADEYRWTTPQIIEWLRTHEQD